jgi:hypothetical protein
MTLLSLNDGERAWASFVELFAEVGDGMKG